LCLKDLLGAAVDKLWIQKELCQSIKFTVLTDTQRSLNHKSKMAQAAYDQAKAKMAKDARST
jgi:hypothetical protein